MRLPRHSQVQPAAFPPPPSPAKTHTSIAKGPGPAPCSPFSLVERLTRAGQGCVANSAHQLRAPRRAGGTSLPRCRRRAAPTFIHRRRRAPPAPRRPCRGRAGRAGAGGGAASERARGAAGGAGGGAARPALYRAARGAHPAPWERARAAAPGREGAPGGRVGSSRRGAGGSFGWWPRSGSTFGCRRQAPCGGEESRPACERRC